MFSIRLKVNREDFQTIKDFLDKVISQEKLSKPTVYLADRAIFYWDRIDVFPLDNEKLSSIIKGSLYVDCYFFDLNYGYKMICRDGESIFWREADSNSRKNRIFLSQIKRLLHPLSG